MHNGKKFSSTFCIYFSKTYPPDAFVLTSSSPFYIHHVLPGSQHVPSKISFRHLVCSYPIQSPYCFLNPSVPDGGKEIVSARFVHPNDALAEFRRKEITLMPPQYYILCTLSDILTGGINTQNQREKVERLSRGAFGKLSINPKHLLMEDSDADPKRMLLVYEGDETRGGPPGRLHRALVKFADHGVSIFMIYPFTPTNLTLVLGNL
jgi:hypothetical protein